MKWQEFYNEGIYLCNPEEKDVFSLIAMGEGYPVKFVVPGMFDESGELNEDVFLNEPTFYLIIRSIVADKKSAEIHMTAKTRGELPAGVRHGTYELTFTNLSFSKDLPADMFEDEDVPHDLLAKREG